MNPRTWPRRAALGAAAALHAAAQGGVQAHGDAGHDGRPAYDASRVEETAFGREGDPRRAGRTVRIAMDDGMRFTPDHIAHVMPGATGALVWQFTQAGVFGFACLQPGHFEAGMVGKVVVR